MILKTIDNKSKKEVFRELGNSFDLITAQKATDLYQKMIFEMFAENISMSDDVFAVIISHSPGIEDVLLCEEDWHFIYTDSGKQFMQIVAPVRK